LKYAIVSDIHANIEALNAVLPVIEAEHSDRIVCLGDLVGYYANPNDCLKIIEDSGIICISGNHDRAAVGLKEMSRLWSGAKHAMIWTQKQLTLESRRFLQSLPLTQIIDGLFLAVHSSLDPDPDADFYMQSEDDTRPTFNTLMQHPSHPMICFFGHTHHAMVYQYDNGAIHKMAGNRIDLNRSCYYLINPGSVGQSRDSDKRASFLIYDTDQSTVSFYRVDYDSKNCLQKARQAGILYEEGILSGWLEEIKIIAKKQFPTLCGVAKKMIRKRWLGGKFSDGGGDPYDRR